MSEQGTVTVIEGQKIRPPSQPLLPNEWAVQHRGVWFVFTPVGAEGEREKWHLLVDFSPHETTKITPGFHSGRPVMIEMEFHTLMERFEAWFSSTDQPDFPDFSVAIDAGVEFAKLMAKNFRPRGSKL